MAKIKQFADTSAVALSYAIDDAPNASEMTATELKRIPYTSEGFQLSKESQTSTAITKDRRISGSKNTRGSASGSATVEFGHTPFVKDMLSLALMGEWQAGDTGEEFITDSDKLNFFVVEKRVRNTVGGAPMNYMERYFGNLVNEATLEVGSSELVTFAVNTMAAFGDINSADATSDENAGGLVATYTNPAAYEIADSANNIEKVVIKDAQGTPLEIVFSDLSLSVTNNVREQVGVGHEFAAGMAMGKVNVQLSGTVYFYDDTVLKAHLNNEYVSAEITVATSDGTMTIMLPKLKAEAPSANSQGENQDYTQSLTLNGEKGEVTIGTTTPQTLECVIAITKTV